MSNNCVKTGAVVWVEPYRATYRGDAYTIGRVMVFRLNNSSATFDKPDPLGVDYVVYDWYEWFDLHATTSTLISRSVGRGLGGMGGPKEELENA